MCFFDRLFNVCKPLLRVLVCKFVKKSILFPILGYRKFTIYFSFLKFFGNKKEKLTSKNY